MMICQCCEEKVDHLNYMGEEKTLCDSCMELYVYRSLKTKKVIAVSGQVNDWAVYLGNDDTPDWWVASHGDKLPQNVAELLFPEFVKELKYRL